jgi:hypothetical protein
MEYLLDSARATREAGREALRSTFLVNGGAAVALLAFLGAALAKDNLARLGQVMNGPLIAFACGVLLSSLGLAFRYLSQSASASTLVEDTALARSFKYQRLAVTSGLLSLAAFLVGIVLVCMAFNAVFTS